MWGDNAYAHRCSRKAVKGGYCEKHCPKTAQARGDGEGSQRDELDHLRAIRAQAIIDTREHIIGGSYLGERTAMMELLGMDERGEIKEGE
jgi:hypothetical protein